MWIKKANEQAGLIVALLSYFLSALIILSALFLKLRRNVTAVTQDDKFIDAFRIGAFIYIDTFLWGNSWDY